MELWAPMIERTCIGLPITPVLMGSISFAKNGTSHKIIFGEFVLLGTVCEQYWYLRQYLLAPTFHRHVCLINALRSRICSRESIKIFFNEVCCVRLAHCSLLQSRTYEIIATRCRDWKPIISVRVVHNFHGYRLRGHVQPIPTIRWERAGYILVRTKCILVLRPDGIWLCPVFCGTPWNSLCFWSER